MEFWSYPALYDENYFPPVESRYWFPRRETMPATDRESAILERLRAVCAHAYEYAPFYRRKWDQAGFHPSHLKSLEDFEMKVPVMQKKDLRDAQERMPPFGDYLCVPETEIFHIHGTSGTTGRLPLLLSDVTIGGPLLTRTPASCGAWACARAT
jgi:phenylacetate-CoA ligase